MNTLLLSLPPGVSFHVAGPNAEQVSGDICLTYFPDEQRTPFDLAVKVSLSEFFTFKMTPKQISVIAGFLRGCLISTSVNRRGHTDKTDEYPGQSG